MNADGSHVGSLVVQVRLSCHNVPQVIVEKYQPRVRDVDATSSATAQPSIEGKSNSQEGVEQPLHILLLHGEGFHPGVCSKPVRAEMNVGAVIGFAALSAPSSRLH